MFSLPHNEALRSGFIHMMFLVWFIFSSRFTRLSAFLSSVLGSLFYVELLGGWCLPATRAVVLPERTLGLFPSSCMERVIEVSRFRPKWHAVQISLCLTPSAPVLNKSASFQRQELYLSCIRHSQHADRFFWMMKYHKYLNWKIIGIFIFENYQLALHFFGASSESQCCKSLNNYISLAWLYMGSSFLCKFTTQFKPTLFTGQLCFWPEAGNLSARRAE